MPISKLAPIVLMMICVSILVWAVVRANAAWHFIAAQAIAQPLFEARGGQTEVFDRSRAHLSTALSRFPDNPDYLDFSGRLYILQSAHPGVVGAERRAHLESAASDFRQALAVRPSWPYGWVNLLSTKDKLEQVDMEFNRALKQSAETGPWERGAQMQIIKSGLRYWGKLGITERALVRQKVLDALKVQPGNAFAVIKDYGRPDLVCGEEEMHAQVRRWCTNVYAKG